MRNYTPRRYSQICRFCEREFEARDSRKMYCSENCRKRWWENNSPKRWKVCECGGRLSLKAERCRECLQREAEWRKRQIVDLYRQGYQPWAIAEMLGVARQTVTGTAYELRKVGVEVPRAKTGGAGHRSQGVVDDADFVSSAKPIAKWIR